MTDSLPRVAFLGAGSMGGAIARGLAQSDTSIDGDIVVTNRSEASASLLADVDGIRSLSLSADPDANEAAVSAARIVIIGVKPDRVRDLAADIAAKLRDGAIVVSLAAGVTIDTLEALFGDGVAVARAMPNTPATVGRAVTGLVRGRNASDADMDAVTRVFASVGDVVVVAEDQIDALSAISGSGPAYVYLLIEAFEQVARDLGFDDDDARRLVEGTFIGAAALLEASDEHPAVLRKNVTSPKGTTEQAIAVMERADLPGVFRQAADAAIARAQEMARETA